MPASNTDKFKKAKRRFATTIGTGGFAQGATTLPLASTAGLDTDTAITLVIDPGTTNEEVITGVVSGSNVINCVRAKEGTTDTAHAAGETVTMYFTETHWDDMIDGVLTSLDQDGTLKASSVDTASVLASDVVTTAKILNSNVTTAKIADAAITNAKLSTSTDEPGAWYDYTPTLTNVTIGNGTVSARYSVIGKTLFYEGKLTRGSTTSFSGGVNISLPKTISTTNKSNECPIGIGTALDSGNAVYYAPPIYGGSATSFYIVAAKADTTYTTISSSGAVNATVPFTWGTGDIYTWSITTEIA
jgi:hypothetical protein